MAGSTAMREHRSKAKHGPRVGDVALRVVRGGSWVFSKKDGQRASIRVKVAPENRFDNLGFRVARNVVTL